MKKKHLSGIDRLLIDATWVLQDQEAFDRNAALGVALSEFPLLADFWGYLLFVEGKAVAMIEMEEDRCGSERNRID